MDGFGYGLALSALLILFVYAVYMMLAG